MTGADKGKILAHVSEIYLSDPNFFVRQSGRIKVIETKQKNVHAWIIGNVLACRYTLDNVKSIVYNPYVYETFMSKDIPATKQDFDVVELLDSGRVQGGDINLI